MKISTKGTRVFFLPILVITCLCLISVSLAQSDISSPQNDDLKFLQDAANNCLWKMNLGDLAVKQAASKDVKEYGEKMAVDHRLYYQELNRFAGLKGISFKADPDRVRKDTLAFFSQEYGAAFDRNYISLMIDENNRDIDLYRKEKEKGQDAEIKNFAARIIKNLEGYVATAEKILLDLPKPVLK